MKKIFFYSSLLALATSCTDEFETLNVQNEKAQGITFEAVEGVDSRMQWDETANSYSPFWYAEKDRIGIYATGVTTQAGDSWDELSTTAMVYKPTQSKKNGVFTSVSDPDLLSFDGDKEARFLAVYPQTITQSSVGGKIVLGTLPNLGNQDQTTLKGDNESMLMYDLTTATRENSYDAVGEKVQLRFQNPLSAIVYKTANVDKYTEEDESGNSVFGKLVSIKYTGLGADNDGDGTPGESGELLPSLITFNTDASFEIDTVSVENKEAAKFVKGIANDAESEIVLTLDNSNGGLTWNDEAMAMMVVNNVNRNKFRQAGLPEIINVVYAFEKIQIESKIKEVSVDFDGFLEFPALDINSYDYLVTLGDNVDDGSNNRTLIVNKGTLTGVFNEDLNTVAWNDTHNDTPSAIEPENFTEIIINEGVVLEEEEFELLEQFTNVTKLTLNGNTELKEGYLDALTQLVNIEMKNVTSIESKSFYLTGSPAAPIFTHVALPAYDFEDLAVNPEILNKLTLQVLDMSGVSIMNAGFPARGLTLEGYEELEKVTVKDGIEIGSNAFNGCVKLNSINGKVLIKGTSAFKNCGTETGYELTEINVIGTEVPANTFEGCKYLKDILVDGTQIVPTKVGTQAFKGCNALVTMDLSSAETVGQEAFMNCAALIGMEKAINGKNVLTVGAEYISKSAFENCDALTYVYFKNATSHGDNILNDCANLAEIKFGTPFTPKVSSAAAVTTLFGPNTSTIKLFVNPEQDVATLNNNNLKVAYSTTFTELPFASITKEDKF